MSVRLNQVTLAANAVEPCIGFYQALGLTLIVDAAPRYVRFEMDSGDTLSLHHEDGWAGADWPLVYLETDDLDAMCAHLKASGYALTAEPEDKRYLWREADVRDPSGNRIRLYHAGENRRFPPWRINAGEAAKTGG